jgi:hypothetical protein
MYVSDTCQNLWTMRPCIDCWLLPTRLHRSASCSPGALLWCATLYSGRQCTLFLSAPTPPLPPTTGGIAAKCILEAPQHLCVVCDEQTECGHHLGRYSMPETSIYSVVCAIQNLWLAARAEGIGVGWVSILDPLAIKELLRIPPAVQLVAYLCLGYVEGFAEVPDLERDGWEKRAELMPLVRADYFDQTYQRI